MVTYCYVTMDMKSTSRFLDTNTCRLLLCGMFPQWISSKPGVLCRRTYKEPSIIAWTGTAICSKTNFRPTGHHRPRSSPLPRVFTVPSFSALFFVSKWLPFSFIFNRGNRKVGWVGETVMLFLVKDSLVKREVRVGVLS
jgi:hypothetical protein